MSKSDSAENSFLKLLFNAVAWANIADNAAAGPLTNLYVALHTADPGEGGNQTTNELAYTGYARVPVARTAGGWTVTGASVSPVAAIVFPVMTGGAGGTVTHASVGTLVAGAGVVLWSGPVTPNIVVTNGVAPPLSPSSTVTED